MQQVGKSAKLRFTKFSLAGNELKALPEHRRNFLVLSSFVYNELNIFTKILAAIISVEAREVHQHDAFAASVGPIIRVLTLKLFEWFATSGATNGAAAANDDQNLLGLFRKHSKRRRTLEKSEIFNVVGIIRDKSAAHFDLPRASLAIDEIENDGRYHFLLSESRGNSFYVLGEEIVFSSLLARAKTPSKGTEEAAQDKLGEIVDWIGKATNFIFEFHEQFAQMILDENLPNHNGDELECNVDRDDIGVIRETIWPLFWLTKEQNSKIFDSN